MVSANTTSCSTGRGPYKNIKNVRECCQYLTSRKIDRTRIWRKVGNVLVVDKVALEQSVKDAGQQSQKRSVIGYCSCGATYPSRVKRGGDRQARRNRQRANRECSRDMHTVSGALARALNPLQGGSVPRNTETSSKLQLLQQFSVTGSEDGNQIRPSEGHAVYVGISTPTSKVEETNGSSREKTEEKQHKKGSATVIGTESQNKFPRSVDDGLLLVVTARINGHAVRAMIDSGAPRCFITPACVTTVGLKGKPQDTFLELGNGQIFLSRGFVPAVPVVTAGLTVCVGLTVKPYFTM